jgi:hypothetical protein
MITPAPRLFGALGLSGCKAHACEGEIMHDVEITFRQNRDGSWDMCKSYPVGDDETGSEHYRYVRTRPANLARITGSVLDKNDRMIVTGTVIENGVGIGHAWPKTPTK